MSDNTKLIEAIKQASELLNKAVATHENLKPFKDANEERRITAIEGRVKNLENASSDKWITEPFGQVRKFEITETITRFGLYSETTYRDDAGNLWQKVPQAYSPTAKRGWF
jgi:hypothetical protein